MVPLHLTRDQAFLVVVDLQERLLPAMHRPDDLLARASLMIRGAHLLGLPILVTEQYPKGLGPTVEPIREALGDAYRPLEKTAFSCCGSPAFLEALQATQRSHPVLIGIEAHVCVLQTALDLAAQSFPVHVLADAVSSRQALDRDLALDRLRQCGVAVETTEMALFQMLQDASAPEFKDLSKLVK